MTRFILSLLLCTLFLYGASTLLLERSIIESFPSFFWTTIIFLNVSTVAVFYFLLKAGPSSFVQLYLLTMVLKLFVYCSYNVVIILQDRPNAGANAGFFLICYLLFTTLELVFLYRRVGM